VETIARALDLRIVLWVEDLERFATAPGTGSTGETGRAEERLGPIRSLLHLLDRKDRITVILASETLDARFDMEKIARFVERIPALDPKNAGDVLDRFRRGCLDGFGDWIDPAKERRERLFEESPEDKNIAAMFGNLPSLTEHLVTLCATARRLKMVLRAALDVWKPLVGEIDPDDVLLMSVLRVTEPDVVSLVDRHINLLREGWEPRGENKNQESPFDEELHQLLSERPEASRNAIWALLRYVFSNWKTKRAPASIKRPQGFAAAGHADYWSRFLAVPDLTEDERDQPVLRELRRWEEDRTGDLPALVSDPERSLAVEDLSTLLSPEAAVELLERVIEERAEESPRKWPLVDSTHHRPPGIGAMREIFDRVTPNADTLEKSLRQAIKRFTPINLSLVWELMYEFFNDQLDNSTPRLHAELTQALVNLSTEAIIQTLREADPRVMFECASSLRSFPQDRSENWKFLASRILEALEREPSVIVPQLLPFLVKENRGGFVLDEAMAAHLFDMDRLRELLRRHPIPESAIPESLREQYRVLMEAIEQISD